MASSALYTVVHSADSLALHQQSHNACAVQLHTTHTASLQESLFCPGDSSSVRATRQSVQATYCSTRWKAPAVGQTKEITRSIYWHERLQSQTWREASNVTTHHTQSLSTKLLENLGGLLHSPPDLPWKYMGAASGSQEGSTAVTLRA